MVSKKTSFFSLASTNGPTSYFFAKTEAIKGELPNPYATESTRLPAHNLLQWIS